MSSPSPDALGLLGLDEARSLTGMSKSAFWRWRRRHRIPCVCGKQVHVDDMRAAIDRERGLSPAKSNQPKK